MGRWLVSLMLFLVMVLGGCNGSSPPTKKHYIVARDPYWYPLDFMGKGDNVLAFSDELLNQIARIEGFSVDIRQDGWSSLIFDMGKGHYSGVLSSLIVSEKNLAEYDFSAPYLYVGDVMVVANNSNIRTLKDLEDKFLAVKSGSLSLLTLEKFPDIVIENYHNTAKALEDLEKGKIDGVVMGILPAYTFVENLYQGRLRVCTMPLTQTGLRLMTLKGENKELINKFNEGMKTLKQNGGYDLLLKKWGLNQ